MISRCGYHQSPISMEHWAEMVRSVRVLGILVRPATMPGMSMMAVLNRWTVGPGVSWTLGW